MRHASRLPVQRVAAILLAAVPLLAGPAASPRGDSLAVFAGGPFWSLEEAFERVPGVEEAVAGYVPLPPAGEGALSGGTDSAAAVPDTLPVFDAVVQGGSGFAFAVQVRFDPGRVSYAELLHAYFRSIDPTARDRQFADSGSQYRTLILYRGPAQEKAARDALEALDRLARSGRFKAPLAVTTAPAGKFLPAEEGRQDHYRRYPGRYRAWLRFSGRAEGLRRLWGEEGPAGNRAGARGKAGSTGSAGRGARIPRGERAQDSGRSSR